MESTFMGRTFYAHPFPRPQSPTKFISVSFKPKRIRISNERLAKDSSKGEMPATHLSPSVDKRRNAGFHPSVWGDYFLTYASQPKMDSADEKIERQIQTLKDEVKSFLVVAASNDNPLELLSLIDHLQRFGIGYQFEKEIDEALKHIHERSSEAMEYSNDLHTIALMFRLLRQDGHKIPSSVFCKFKGPDGNFDKSIESDARGLLSLYEACHFRIHNEDILEEALTFSLTHLTSLKDKLSPPVRDEISRALKHPIRKGFKRVQSWNFIKIYEEETSHNEVLLKLAKLEFNRVQKIHQKELGDNTRWWKTLDVQENFPFARDRMVECYFWGLLAYEPEFTAVRKIFSKAMALYTIWDDIYDVHGTMEELELFTRAIERWDVEVIDELPEYMQLFYQALLNLYTEIEQMLPEEERSYRMYYGIKSLKNLAKAHLQEAKWFHQQYIPSMEEYMAAGWVTGGGELAFTTAILGMTGDVTTKDTFKWLFGFPKMVRACTTALRLVDDLANHKFEQKRGHSATSVESYMKQHGVTEEEAEDEVRKIVDDAWKDINEELLQLTVVPRPVLNMFLKVMSLLDCTYNEADLSNNEADFLTVANIGMKDTITSILVDPFPIDM